MVSALLLARAPRQKDLEKERGSEGTSARLKLQLSRPDLVHSTIVNCSQRSSRDEERGRQTQLLPGNDASALKQDLLVSADLVRSTIV